MSEYRLNNKEIKAVFEALGFKTRIVNGQDMYEKDGVYYHLDYINREYGYAIETADSVEDAKMHRMEDGAVVELGESKEETMKKITECLKEFFI